MSGVKDILIPLNRGTPRQPYVDINAKLAEAVEAMINSGVNRIVVVRRGYPVGMIRLHDAVKKLGIQVTSSR